MELETENHLYALSTVFKYCKGIGMMQGKIYAKPSLTERQKVNRLIYVLNQIDIFNPDILTFFSQTNRVHLDEKWFFLQPPGEKY